MQIRTAAGEPEVVASNDGDSALEADFEDFYVAQQDWVRRLAYVLTGDVSQAEDLAQESFARIYKRFPTLTNPRAYLRVTLVNLHRRQHRNAQRQRHGETTVQVSANDAHGELLDLIDRLPTKQRAVLVLRYYEDLTEAEIASVLSCRPGTVKSLSARAIARLRRELEE